MEILYELKTLRRVAAVIREVKPNVILTHPPVDYMEDHTNTCRLVVTAAFHPEWLAAVTAEPGVGQAATIADALTRMGSDRVRARST